MYNAGRLAWRLRETGLQTPEQKTSVSDIVTEADKAAEAFVAGVLELVRPADGVLGEEGTHRASESGKTWVIDPVDGTYNFASGSDYFCSAVALVSGSPADPTEVIFGAVHRPAMGYTWFGGPNVPSTKDGKPLMPLVDKPLNMVSLGTYIHPSSLADPKIFSAWNKWQPGSQPCGCWGPVRLIWQRLPMAGWVCGCSIVLRIGIGFPDRPWWPAWADYANVWRQAG